MLSDINYWLLIALTTPTHQLQIRNTLSFTLQSPPHTHTHTHTHTQRTIRYTTHVHTIHWARLCMDVHVCMYNTSMYVHVYACTCTHVLFCRQYSAHVCRHTCTHVFRPCLYVHLCMYTCTFCWRYMLTHVCRHTCTHVWHSIQCERCTCTYACVCACMFVLSIHTLWSTVSYCFYSYIVCTCTYADMYSCITYMKITNYIIHSCSVQVFTCVHMYRARTGIYVGTLTLWAQHTVFVATLKMCVAMFNYIHARAYT